ncbi:riboflavin kinase / FMN adenylyltransferase [Nonlabens sp. Hel1_33_55]|uniref:bifunctional riboflavin kinase/FAD synthetase n=1 Tax=Nonlabens sp. Hel1_33_55 TaxID=1336802 RepID=UPI000875E64B|nr:bifunctional riboflavin kinase/FAD synthetase [Nonlabens sp. Hel1_33_55]SCY42353.1 riboflavin kinase / FMN adenylyltransferase [Nonlabens sp. Hel1_33_55]
MNTYKQIDQYKASKKAVVTIGTFDGVHHGHQQILQKVVDRAKTEDLTTVLLTFFPHPRMVLQPEYDLKLINTINERVDLVAKTGVEHMIIHPFSKEFSRTSAREYVKDILVDQLNAAVVVIGYDHHYGRNRSANIDNLRQDAEDYGFELIEITKEEIDEVAVSSTKIRSAINDGEIQIANQYLGRAFSIHGSIVKGKQIGRTINYPTANLDVVEKYKLIPKMGVYITSSVINGKRVYGMTNIGKNPTVSDADGSITIETFYIDFDKDLYGQEMELFFHKRLRDEAKFNSMDELKKIMATDEQKTRDYASNA